MSVKMTSAILVLGLAMVLTSIHGTQAGHLKDPELDKIPPEYQNKHMPEGWWTDPKIIEEGDKIFHGLHEAILDPAMVCMVCHGKDGTPILTGARDFRDGSYVNRMTDSYWFWRVSEGIPDTPMPPWKKMLTEEERWKAIAYEHTFSHGGKPAEHNHGIKEATEK